MNVLLLEVQDTLAPAVRKLTDAGHHVLVYDNLSRGHREAVPDGLLIEGELTDTATLTRVLTEHGIEAVMHFAAFALVNESVNDPAQPLPEQCRCNAFAPRGDASG